MTRLEFMKELESLLPDIPLEERNEALQYYNGYFDDAGEDQEEEIIKELGSPSKVAALIKADLNSNATDRENRGYFTEKGYQDTFYQEAKYEIVGSNNEQSENAQESESTEANNSNNNSESASSGSYNNNRTNANGTNNANGSNQNYTNANAGSAGQSTYNNSQQANKSSNTVLIVILAVFTSPIWLSLVMSVLGVAFGIIMAILGIIFGFGVAGVTMIGVGIALFIAGLIQISVPFVGILLVGCGLLVLGIGMLFTLGGIMLCKTVLPALIKGIVNLCRMPFKNRSVMA